jgi:hypothetical protein
LEAAPSGLAKPKAPLAETIKMVAAAKLPGLDKRAKALTKATKAKAVPNRTKATAKRGGPK